MTKLIAITAAVALVLLAFLTALGGNDLTKLLSKVPGYIAVGPLASFAGDQGGKPIYRIDTGTRVVALSFDDGPDPSYTLQVLKTLRDKEAKATFFVVGAQAEKHPDIIAEMVRQGHEVANHTWSHPEMNSISASDMMAEVTATNLLISKLTGRPNNLFRPPKGVLTAEEKKELNKAGFVTILWAIGIENREAKNPSQMAERVLENIKPGDIILLHDGRLDRTKTVQALPLLLDGLKQRGFKTVTVGELLTTGPYYPAVN